MQLENGPLFHTQAPLYMYTRAIANTYAMAVSGSLNSAIFRSYLIYTTVSYPK